jgi:hypothetical protein
MDNVEAAEDLTLIDAVLRWTNPQLLEAVKGAERLYIAHHLNEFYRQMGGFRFRILSDAQVMKPSRDGWMGGPSYEWLIAAWNDLESDFRRRLSTDIYLYGVQIAPSPETAQKPIPQAWASDAKFDLGRSAVEVVGRRYASVRASRKAPDLTEAAAPVQAVSTSLPPITETSVRALMDDEVLLLLEEHGRRVVETDAGPFIQPSRVSFGPILLRRMHWRAENDQLCETLTAECTELIRWLKTKIEHHQIPTAKAAEEPLREAYRRLKAGSRT